MPTFTLTKLEQILLPLIPLPGLKTLHKGQETESVIVPHFFLLLHFLCLQMPEHCANIIYREMCQNGNHLIQNQAETLTL